MPAAVFRSFSSPCPDRESHANPLLNLHKPLDKINMKIQKVILFIDFIINLILGILLLAYSNKLAEYLGVPEVESSFYPNILGGVFVGIALALLIEFFNKPDGKTSGLGLLGAIAINLCGGLILIIWLLFGDLGLPMRGSILLSSLAVLLIVLSCFELLNHYKTGK